MRAKDCESNIKSGGSENTRRRLASVFLAAPLLWIVLGDWFGEQVIFGRHVVVVAYSAAILVGGNASLPVKQDSHRRLRSYATCM